MNRKIPNRGLWEKREPQIFSGEEQLSEQEKEDVLSKWQNGMCRLDPTVEGNKIKVLRAKDKGAI